jgi:dienelactone hydrolase
MGAALWAPESPGPVPGVLVLMEAYGLTPHIERVARRLAEDGFVALAPDLYHRFARRRVPYDAPDRAADLTMRTIALSGAAEERAKDDRVLADVASALSVLASHPQVDADALAVVGFGMGGHLSFLAACRFCERVRAAVSFYGGRIVPILGEARALSAPLLLCFGASDRSIPAAQVDRIRAELEYLGKTHRVCVYEDAEHGFFCEERACYAPLAAEKAWQDTLGWLREHLRS